MLSVMRRVLPGMSPTVGLIWARATRKGGIAPVFLFASLGLEVMVQYRRGVGVEAGGVKGFGWEDGLVCRDSGVRGNDGRGRGMTAPCCNL